MDLQEVQDNLVALGVHPGDAMTPSALALIVQLTDELAFGEAHADITVSPSPHPVDSAQVAYHEAEGSEPECYVVYAPGLASKLDKHHEVRQLFLTTVLRRSPLDMQWLFWALA